MTSTSAKILLAALGVASLTTPVFGAAESVGVTAAVNPDATGQIPNEPLRELMVGHDVIRNERIKTESIGQAQLLFTDQSTLTVARNSCDMRKAYQDTMGLSRPRAFKRSRREVFAFLSDNHIDPDIAIEKGSA